MAQIEQKILEFLSQNQVNCSIREHEPVYTSKKMAEALETDENRIAKSMILKKDNGEHFLAVLPGKMKVDFARLSTILDAKSISLAPVKEAEEIAECPVGSVHPFGNLINLVTVFDKKLLSSDYLFFNPGSHTRSIKINTLDLVKLVKPHILEFTKSH